MELCLSSSLGEGPLLLLQRPPYKEHRLMFVREIIAVYSENDTIA